MKKGELINEVSKVVKTKEDARAAVDGVLSSINKALEKDDALVARRAHLERMASNGTIHMKLGDVVRMRIEEIELQHNMLYAVQTEAYLQKAIAAWGKDPSIFDINRDMIQRLLNTEARRLKKAGKDNYAANRLRKALHALFQWTIDRYDLVDQKNPVARTKKFPITERVKYVPEQWELDMVEQNLNAEQRLLFLFLLQTGCRLGEALNLKVKDLDFDKRLVTLWSRKSKGTNLVYRSVPMPLIVDEFKLPSSPNARIFKTWSSHPVFLDKTIQRVNAENATVALSNWKETWKTKMMTRFNWHNLRHRTCSRWLKDNMPIDEVMHRLGHKNLAETMAYAQLLGYSQCTFMESQVKRSIVGILKSTRNARKPRKKVDLTS